MKLVSMKRKRETESDETKGMDSPEYPYGLQINLEGESLDALGLKLPAVGEKMTLHVRVEAVSASEYKHKEGEQRSASLQITDMAVVDESDKMRRAAAKLYGG